jgi:broad specificity phosphatase PhoE
VTEFLLVRHAETEWNRDQRYQGHADPSLNETGRDQARALADALAGEQVDAIYASDLRRASETAEIVGERLGLPVTQEPDLREIDVGSWSGLTREEVEGREWDGETSEEQALRVHAALRRIGELHPAGRVLVVTHGGSMRRVFEAMGDEPPRLANCEVFRVRSENGTLRGID